MTEKEVEGCFQLPKLPQRAGSRVSSHSRKASLVRSTATPGRRSSLCPGQSADFSLIDSVVAERRKLDISLLSAPDRKTHFPIPRRFSAIQTAISGPRPREKRPENSPSKPATSPPNHPKPASKAYRLIKALNWVPIRLNSFFPLSPFDHLYRGPAKTSYALGSQVVWTDAEVLDYQKATDRYEIRLIAVRSGLVKSVQRVNLMFEGEEKAFQELLKQAHRLKKEAENRLNVDLFIAGEMGKGFELTGNPIVFLGKIVNFIGRIWREIAETRKKEAIADINGFFDYAYLRGVLIAKWDNEDITALRTANGVTDFALLQPAQFYAKQGNSILVSKDTKNRLKAKSLFSNSLAFQVLFSFKSRFCDYFASGPVFQSIPDHYTWVQFLHSQSSKSVPNLSTRPMHFRTFFKFQMYRIEQIGSFIRNNWIHEAACQVYDAKGVNEDYQDRLGKKVELVAYELLSEEVSASFALFLTLFQQAETVFFIDIDFTHDGKAHSILLKPDPAPSRLQGRIYQYSAALLSLCRTVPGLRGWSQGQDCPIERESTSQELQEEGVLRQRIEGLVREVEEKVEEIGEFGRAVEGLEVPETVEKPESAAEALAAIHQLEAYLTPLFAQRQAVLCTLKSSYQSGLFLLKSHAFRSFLLTLTEQRISQACLRLSSLLHAFGLSIHTRCTQLVHLLEQPVGSVEELIEAVATVQHIKREDLPLVRKEVETLFRGMGVLKWVWTLDIAGLMGEIKGQFERLERTIEGRETALEKDKPKYMRRLEQDRDALKVSIKSLSMKFQDFTQLPLSESLEVWMSEAAATATGLLAIAKEVETARNRLNRKESVLGLEPSKHYILDKFLTCSPPVLDFALRSAEVKNDMQIWKNTQLRKIDPVKITEIIRKSKADFFALLPKLTSSQQQIASFLGQELDQFLEYMEIATLLQHESLKDRHWKQICEILGLSSEVYLDLGAVIGKSGHVPPKSEAIAAVVKSAAGEMHLETQLRQHRVLFHSLTFQLSPHRSTFLLTQHNQLRSHVADFRAIIKLIGDSECIPELKNQALDWARKMDTLEQLLTEWINAQEEMTALEEIFSRENSQESSQAAFAEYEKLVLRLTKILVEIAEQPEVLRCREMHIRYFQSCGQQLKTCRLQLQTEAEEGQFYGLSDSQMMQLLGSADMY